MSFRCSYASMCQENSPVKVKQRSWYEVCSNTATVAELVNICDNKRTSFTNGTNTQ